MTDFEESAYEAEAKHLAEQAEIEEALQAERDAQARAEAEAYELWMQEEQAEAARLREEDAA